MNDIYVGQLFSEAYLEHYGVLGMKWGVRRYQNADGTLTLKGKKRYGNKTHKDKKGLTDKQKKALIIGASTIGATLAIYGAYRYSSNLSELSRPHVSTLKFGSNLDINSLSTTPTVISKTTKFQRMSTKSVEDFAEEGQRIFASFEKDDNHIYKAQMPEFFKRWKNEGIVKDSTPYVHSLKLKRDIKLASDKDVADAYMKVNNLTSIDQGRYQQFMRLLGDSDNKVVKAFTSELVSKGFDGMIDYNDAGIIANKPALIFNPKDVIASDKSRKLRSVEKFINVLTY